VARNHHHRRVDSPLAAAGQRYQAVHPGQPDVEDDDVERRPRDPVETRLAAVHRLDRIPLVTQHAAKRAAHAGLVVDDQD